MLTKDDKKFILETISQALRLNNKVLDKKFEDVNKSISNLATDVVDLFEATNSALIKVEDRLNEKIGKISDQIDDINAVIVNHENRIKKVEEKVFITTTSS